jgi:hypothetical protein
MRSKGPAMLKLATVGAGLGIGVSEICSARSPQRSFKDWETASVMFVMDVGVMAKSAGFSKQPFMTALIRLRISSSVMESPVEKGTDRRIEVRCCQPKAQGSLLLFSFARLEPWLMIL